MDEVTSITVAQGPVKGIYERSALAGNALPPFFLVLKPFVQDSGPGLECRTRILSVAAGTLSILVFIAVVYLWRQKQRTALLAGALLAINPLHLWYSQEVRGYPLMLLFGLLTLLCFELARQKRKAVWWVLYALASLIAIGMHKTAITFPIACGLWHGWDVIKKKEPWYHLLLHAPAALGSLAVFMLKTYPPLEGYSRSASGLEIGYTFLTFLGGYSFGPSVTDIQSYGPWAAISKHSIQTGILLIALLPVALLCLSKLRRLAASKELQLLVLGIGIVSFASLISGFPYNVRYALPGLLGFLALIAVLACESERPFFARLMLVSLLIIALWADLQWFYSWQYRKGDSRAVAQWLIDNEQAVHSWTVLPGYASVPVEWYLKPSSTVLAKEMPPKEDRTTSFPPVPDVLIIGRRHHLKDPNEVIAAFASAAGGAQTNNAFSGFELYIAAPATNATTRAK